MDRQAGKGSDKLALKVLTGRQRISGEMSWSLLQPSRVSTRVIDSLKIGLSPSWRQAPFRDRAQTERDGCQGVGLVASGISDLIP